MNTTETTAVQVLLDKHLIWPTKQEEVDTHLNTMTNCIILTVLTEGTTVKIQTRIGLPKKIILDITIMQQVIGSIIKQEIT